MPGRLLRKTWKHDPTLGAPARYKRACAYEAFVPDKLASLSLHIEASVAGLFSEAEAAIRRLNDQASTALDPLARLLLRTESIASSKIEGLQLGVRQLARAEAKAESGMRASPTAMEVLANIDAMVVALDEAVHTHTFGHDEIVAVHKRLMRGAPNAHVAGVIRTTQNWIGGNDYNPCGADFVPPPPEHVAGLMEDLCTAILDDTLPPLMQAALVHAQFETIHPFHDGNGRTGRALIHVVLRRRGVAPRFLPPISVVLAGSRDRYIAGLGRFRGDDVSAWLEHFAAATHKSAELATAYVGLVGELQERWRGQLRNAGSSPRADAAAWTIIDLLPAHPMISGPVAVAATKRAKSRVYEAIEQLINARVLIPVSEGKRNRWWEAAGLLDLIAELEAGQLPVRKRPR